MLSDREILDILIRRQVLLEGHFLLTSGRHSQYYFEKFRILQYPEECKIFCQQIAQKFSDRSIQTVAGPTTGGIIIAYQVAQFLEAKAIYAERTPQGRDFLRGMSLSPGEKVLVVDDVLTTGGSVRETVDAVRRGGGDVVGISVFIDRSAQAPDFAAPFFPVYRQEVITFPASDCPLCRQGLPLQKPGSRPL